MQERNPWHLLMTALATPLGLGALAATLMALVAGLGWPLELASHFRVHYLLASVVSAALLLAAGHRKTAAAAAVVVALNVVSIGPLYWPAGNPIEGGTPLRLLLINVNQGNSRHADVLAEIERHDPDVVLLQEVTPVWAAALRRLDPDYPHRWVVERDGYFGISIHSRLPLDTVETTPLADPRFPSIVTRLTVGGRQVRLLGTHPPPPVRAELVAARDRQLEAVAEWVAGEETPAIVLGDLNASPFSPVFRRLRRDSGLANAMTGHGVVPTWPVDRPWLRIPIDHCLHDRRLSVVRAARGQDIGSDHFPLVVDLLIPPG